MNGIHLLMLVFRRPTHILLEVSVWECLACQLQNKIQQNIMESHKATCWQKPCNWFMSIHSRDFELITTSALIFTKHLFHNVLIFFNIWNIWLCLLCAAVPSLYDACMQVLKDNVDGQFLWQHITYLICCCFPCYTVT